MKNRQFIFFCLLLAGNQLVAQDKPQLTLEQCYNFAAANSPLAQQKALTITAGRMAEKNQNLKWLPQVDLNGQATYQSDVTNLPIKIPNITIDPPSKDQYKGTLSLVQPIYDGGIIAAQKKLQQISTELEGQKVEVDLYQLKSKINAYFFTALLMDENIALMSSVTDNLYNNIKRVKAQAENGIATKSNVDVLQAELLKITQNVIEFKAVKKGAVEMLGVLTGTVIDTETDFVRPAGQVVVQDTLVARPELKLFDFQKQLFQQQSKLISAKTNPKLSFFSNGGYGRPGLNQLENQFQWFYIGGVTVSIPITGRFTQKREKSVFIMQEQIVDKQKENFLNINRQLTIQQRNEVEKYQQLVATDEEIVSLRTKIKDNASFKLVNGIITSTDYVTDLNAENQARLTQKLHEIQWLQSQYNYQLILGK